MGYVQGRAVKLPGVYGDYISNIRIPINYKPISIMECQGFVAAAQLIKKSSFEARLNPRSGSGHSSSVKRCRCHLDHGNLRVPPLCHPPLNNPLLGPYFLGGVALGGGGVP